MPGDTVIVDPSEPWIASKIGAYPGGTTGRPLVPLEPWPPGPAADEPDEDAPADTLEARGGPPTPNAAKTPSGEG